MRTLLSLLAVVVGFFGGNHHLFSQTWSVTSAPLADWLGVASSADGTKLIAVSDGFFAGSVGIYISTNSGSDWSPTSAPSDPDANRWQAVASSADGAKLIAACGGRQWGKIYLSTNSGVTWKLTSAPNDNYQAVASSPDGTKLAAAASYFAPYHVYTSTNAGATWLQSGPWAYPFNSIAISADGTKVVATASALWAGYAGGFIAYSTNSGVPWQAGNAPSDLAWHGVVCSTNGRIMAAVASCDTNYDLVPVYVSFDYGAHWAPTSSPLTSWSCITCSADGSKLIAAWEELYNETTPVPSPPGIYTSTNSGGNWTQSTDLNGAACIASSADGNKLLAGAGYIMVSPAQASTSVPTLGIVLSRKSIILFWPTDQTGYNVQYNASLASTNWIALTNAPIVTNGQNQVLLAITNKPHFYRLAGP
jgi:hypothetical protein